MNAINIHTYMKQYKVTEFNDSTNKATYYAVYKRFLLFFWIFVRETSSQYEVEQFIRRNKQKINKTKTKYS